MTDTEKDTSTYTDTPIPPYNQSNSPAIHTEENSSMADDLETQPDSSDKESQSDQSDLSELQHTVMNLSYNDYMAVLQTFDASALSLDNANPVERKRAAFYLELLIARGSVFVFEDNENPEKKARTILAAIPVEEPIFAMFFANIAAMKEYMRAIDNANTYYDRLVEDRNDVDGKHKKYKFEYDEYVGDRKNGKNGGLFGLSGLSRMIEFGSSKEDDVEGEVLDRVSYYEDRISRSEQLMAGVKSDITELKNTLDRLTEMDREFSRRLTEYFSEFDM